MIIVQEVKDFLNITGPAADEFISGCINKAVGEINILTNRRLDYREMEYYAGKRTGSYVYKELNVNSFVMKYRRFNI